MENLRLDLWYDVSIACFFTAVKCNLKEKWNGNNENFILMRTETKNIYIYFAYIYNMQLPLNEKIYFFLKMQFGWKQLFIMFNKKI